MLCSLELNATLVTPQEISGGWISGKFNLDISVGLSKMYYSKCNV
jgi:hypothetical protein